MWNLVASTGLAAFVVASPVSSTISPASALEIPALTGRVVDLAHALTPDERASLSTALQAHEERTGNQVAVLILPSLEGEPIEEYSHRVATSWKLGRKGTDNGVLLLVALKERKLRIEVGYGLEGTLTDLRSAHIIRDDIAPRFRAGDIPGGIGAGVDAILRTIEGTYQAQNAPGRGDVSGVSAFQYALIGIAVGFLAGMVLSQGLGKTRALFGSVLAYLVAQTASLLWGLLAAGVTAALLWIALRVRPLARRGRTGDDWAWYSSRGGGWGGGSFDAGGFSGGGGDFGGGGASGDW